LQVGNEDDLRQDGVVEGDIAFAFDEEVVEGEVERVEPPEEWSLGDLIEADDEVWKYATNDAPGVGIHHFNITGVCNHEDKEERNDPIDHHIRKSCFTLHFVNFVIVGKARVSVRDHVDQKMRNKPKKKSQERSSDCVSDHSA